MTIKIENDIEAEIGTKVGFRHMGMNLTGTLIGGSNGWATILYAGTEYKERAFRVTFA